ncbi:SpaH/EbpB family LPXTG-anchored major pilin [Arthrobacter sp. NPDC090010]|uniref:SpaH/EbpB family LPXTG-anchored major pilin n=1 Tax=Arthrobacter sp. NPDC090010 TaxID=3363942 RepID=UPI00380436EA
MSLAMRGRAVRAAIATAVGAALFALSVAPAQAAPLVDLDPGATSTLTIHKFEQPEEFGEAADGLPRDTAGLKPMPGVGFTVQKVQGIDLTTNAGWAEAAALSADEAKSRTEKPGRTLTTGTDGVAVFSGLPLGLYLVSESSAPAGVTPSKPFLVTLPLTHPTDRDHWLYDVHVYPKNAVITAEKSVKDSPGVKLGDEVEFTIRADIPRVKELDGYKIVDPLDTRLDHVSTAIRLSNGAAIAEGQDYTVSFDKSSNTVTVEFTEAGRKILVDNATAARVEVVIKTAANSTGEIENEAIVYPNRPSFDHKPGEPGGPIVPPAVETKWGRIVLEKADAGDAGKRLAGAAFQVFVSEADARAQRDAVEINGVSEWTTAENGRVDIAGLRCSNFADGEELQPGDPRWRSYWLVETKSPDGYELLAEPVKVDVTGDDPAKVTISVKNVPHNAGFELPLTGGVGTGLLYVGGALLLAGACVAVAVRKRRADAGR